MANDLGMKFSTTCHHRLLLLPLLVALSHGGLAAAAPAEATAFANGPTVIATFMVIDDEDSTAGFLTVVATTQGVRSSGASGPLAFGFMNLFSVTPFPFETELAEGSYIAPTGDAVLRFLLDPLGVVVVRSSYSGPGAIVHAVSKISYSEIGDRRYTHQVHAVVPRARRITAEGSAGMYRLRGLGADVSGDVATGTTIYTED